MSGSVQIGWAYWKVWRFSLSFDFKLRESKKYVAMSPVYPWKSLKLCACSCNRWKSSMNEFEVTCCWRLNYSQLFIDVLNLAHIGMNSGMKRASHELFFNKWVRTENFRFSDVLRNEQRTSIWRPSK